MSVEKQIEQSERMSLEEIQRYELPVSFEKLQELLGNSEVDDLKDKLESALLEIDELSEDKTFLDFKVSDLEVEIEGLKEKITVLESDNVCNIQR